MNLFRLSLLTELFGFLAGTTKDESANNITLDSVKATGGASAACNDGAYFMVISPGTYSVEYKKSGYKDHVENNVDIDEASTTFKHVVMEEGFSAYEETIEGEAASLVYPMSITIKSGTTCIRSLEDENGTATFTFSLPGASNVAIRNRNRCDASDENSVYIKMDSGTEEIYSMKVKDDRWDWDYVRSYTQDPKIYTNLAAGTHSFRIRSRQRKARIDKIVLIVSPA